jgi:hypothetical protein
MTAEHHVRGWRTAEDMNNSSGRGGRTAEPNESGRNTAEGMNNGSGGRTAGHNVSGRRTAEDMNNGSGM